MRRIVVLAGLFLATAACAAAHARAAGATIVFSSNRDGDDEVYSMDADGSNIVQLTFNSAPDYGASCSPDGRRIAFVSERDGNMEIYVMNVDGSEVQRLTNNAAGDYTPDWSRDGSRIAFASERDGDAEIFVMNGDGGELQQLTHNTAADGSPGWSPDGTRIAFHSEQSGVADIWVMNADGTNPQNLTPGPAPDYMPDFSPDGARIVFESTRNGPLELYIMNANGSNVQRLTYTGTDNHEPDWSPDGSQILFMSLQGGDYDVALINSNGTGFVNLSSASPAREWGVSWRPEVIDDASLGGGTGMLAFCNQPVSGSDIHELYIIHMDGTQRRKLVDAPIGLNHHEWSPDGQTLAAVGYVDASTWSIYTVDADGTDLTRRTNAAGVWDSEPSWSTDGSQLAWGRTYPSDGYRTEIWVMNADGSGQHTIGVSGDGVRWVSDNARLLYHKVLAHVDIWSCNVDGTDEQQLTTGPGDNMTPDPSPDGSRIAFVSNRDGNFEIYAMNSDGSDQRRLTNNATSDFSPTWSPDGTLIAFERDVTGADRSDVFVMDSSGTDIRRVTHSPPDRTAINPDWQPADSTIVGVYLKRFFHETIGNTVRLEWDVEEDAVAADFHVVARQDGERRDVGVDAAGPRRFQAVDAAAALRAGGRVVYELYAVADDGGWDLLGTERVELASPYGAGRVVGVFPNPFNPHTTVSFALNHPEPVRITIYDVSGRPLATLVDARLPAGDHQARWDGRDKVGNRVASGVYLLRFVADKTAETRKLVLVR